MRLALRAGLLGALLTINWPVAVQATMTVFQAFPEVWLPTSMEINLAMTLALGQVDVRYGLEYHDYRRADVTTKVGIPEAR